MIIDYTMLSDEALSNLLTEFVMRENDNLPVPQKLAQIKTALINNSAVIYYDEEHEQINIVPKYQL